VTATAEHRAPRIDPVERAEAKAVRNSGTGQCKATVIDARANAQAISARAFASAQRHIDLASPEPQSHWPGVAEAQSHWLLHRHGWPGHSRGRRSPLPWHWPVPELRRLLPRPAPPGRYAVRGARRLPSRAPFARSPAASRSTVTRSAYTRRCSTGTLTSIVSIFPDSRAFVPDLNFPYARHFGDVIDFNDSRLDLHRPGDPVVDRMDVVGVNHFRVAWHVPAPIAEVNMEAGGGEFGSSAEDFVAMQKPERFVTVVQGDGHPMHRGVQTLLGVVNSIVAAARSS